MSVLTVWIAAGAVCDLGIHMLDQVRDGSVHYAERRVRVEADGEHEHHERQRRHNFPQIHVRQVLVMRVRDLAEGHPLIKPEHVARAQDDAERRDDRIRLVVQEGARAGS